MITDEFLALVWRHKKCYSGINLCVFFILCLIQTNPILTSYVIFNFKRRTKRMVKKKRENASEFEEERNVSCSLTSLGVFKNELRDYLKK